MPLTLTASSFHTFTANGLTQTKVEASIEWTGTKTVNTGASAQDVTNGSVTFFGQHDSLSGGDNGPGVLRFWVREVGSGFNGDAIGDIVVERGVGKDVT